MLPLLIQLPGGNKRIKSAVFFVHTMYFSIILTLQEMVWNKRHVDIISTKLLETQLFYIVIAITRMSKHEPFQINIFSMELARKDTSKSIRMHSALNPSMIALPILNLLL